MTSGDGTCGTDGRDMDGDMDGTWTVKKSLFSGGSGGGNPPAEKRVPKLAPTHMIGGPLGRKDPSHFYLIVRFAFFVLPKRVYTEWMGRSFIPRRVPRPWVGGLQCFSSAVFFPNGDFLFFPGSSAGPDP